MKPFPLSLLSRGVSSSSSEVSSIPVSSSVPAILSASIPVSSAAVPSSTAGSISEESPVTLPESSEASSEASKPTEESIEEKATGNASNDELIEIEDSTDGRLFDTGVAVKMDTSYSDGDSWETSLANLRETVKSYGIQVSESGFFGNGASSTSGYFRVSQQDSTGRQYICIYNWRHDATNNGMNKTLNSALVTFKYYLGKENGETFWKFFDSCMTQKGVNASDYGIIDNGGDSDVGDYVMPDGTIVTYDYSSEEIQIIYYLT